ENYYENRQVPSSRRLSGQSKKTPDRFYRRLYRQKRGGKRPGKKRLAFGGAPGQALRTKYSRTFDYFSSHGRGGQRQHDRACHERNKSAGLRGRLVQTALGRRNGP